MACDLAARGILRQFNSNARAAAPVNDQIFVVIVVEFHINSFNVVMFMFYCCCCLAQIWPAAKHNVVKQGQRDINMNN